VRFSWFYSDLPKIFWDITVQQTTAASSHVLDSSSLIIIFSYNKLIKILIPYFVKTFAVTPGYGRLAVRLVAGLVKTLTIAGHSGVFVHYLIVP
jgi:hypothetical protein